MSALSFTVNKGQTYNITIKPADADGALADLSSPPTAVAADPSEFQLGAVSPVGDGTYVLSALALKSGTSAINIHAVGASDLTAEADGTVPLGLATQLLLSGSLAS